MTHDEAAVIEAAMELHQMQRALDCGLPAQKHYKRDYKALMEACERLAAEHDGVWTYPPIKAAKQGVEA